MADLDLVQREGAAGVRLKPALLDANAIVTHIEVNRQHGVGVLVQRLFSDSSNILSVRSRDYFKGCQEFGAQHVRISSGGDVVPSLHGSTVKRILCVPYFPEDARNAIALKEIFHAPLCTYLMDDQNLSTDGIADELMAELLEKSALRLAISAELCKGYEEKYGHKIWFMPPLAPAQFIPPNVNYRSRRELGFKEAVIVGNIWGHRWIELLRETVRGTRIRLRWYNHGEFRNVDGPIAELAADGIVPMLGRDDDRVLVNTLRCAPFVVVPSGILDETDDRRFIAQLSLPSRIPYIFATSHAPILVLGSPETAAARFVSSAGIGLVSPYESGAFRETTDLLLDPAKNRTLRDAAFRLSRKYTDAGAADWIWESLARGEPVDDRYQKLTPVA